MRSWIERETAIYLGQKLVQLKLGSVSLFLRIVPLYNISRRGPVGIIISMQMRLEASCWGQHAVQAIGIHHRETWRGHHLYHWWPWGYVADGGQSCSAGPTWPMSGLMSTTMDLLLAEHMVMIVAVCEYANWHICPWHSFVFPFNFFQISPSLRLFPDLLIFSFHCTMGRCANLHIHILLQWSAPLMSYHNAQESPDSQSHGNAMQLSPVGTHELVSEAGFWEFALTPMSPEVSAKAYITCICEKFPLCTGEPMRLV